MGPTPLLICPACDAVIDAADVRTPPRCPDCGRPLPEYPAAPVATATGDAAHSGDVRHALVVLDGLWEQARDRYRTSTLVILGLFRKRVLPTRTMGLSWLAVGVWFGSQPWSAGITAAVPRWLAAALALALCVAAAGLEMNGAVAYVAARRAYRASRAKVEAGRPLERGDWGCDREHVVPNERPRRTGLWLAIYVATAVLCAGIALGGPDLTSYGRRSAGMRIVLPAIVGQQVIDPDRLRTVAQVWTWVGGAATIMLVGAAMRAPKAE